MNRDHYEVSNLAIGDSAVTKDGQWRVDYVVYLDPDTREHKFRYELWNEGNMKTHCVKESTMFRRLVSYEVPSLERVVNGCVRRLPRVHPVNGNLYGFDPNFDPKNISGRIRDDGHRVRSGGSGTLEAHIVVQEDQSRWS